MTALDPTEEQVKLINIIQDHFKKPAETQGHNILKTSEEIFCSVQALWPSQSYTAVDIRFCLSYLNFDFIERSTQAIAWLIIPVE